MADTTVKMKVLVTADTTQADQAAERARKKIQAAYKAENSGARAQGQASEDSGMSRGLGGLTGAAGRDFAKQSQGMGGLVHIYATFAANIFALSAAFTALSKAADTTNMVKGLDQLGAQSGNALGSLSKQLVKATDGAISLRDAMSSVAMSSSAGMTSDAILRMGTVAKQASQALGVSMADAMNRLSRGVTKLEPELLDELGIFTRVDKASQEYARSIGKSAAALTDFEKRQAFANAVLSEGEKKFGALNLDANPYSKLSASLADVAQNGLELINKVLEPLVKYMASSPTGLTVAVSAIAGILLKQAVPALGMVRQNAKILEEETRARVIRQLKEQQEAAVQRDVIAATRAEKEFLLEKTTAERISKLQNQEFTRKTVGQSVRGLLRKSPFDLTTSEISEISAKHRELEDRVAKGGTDAEIKALKALDRRKKAITDLYDEMDARGNAAAVANEARENKGMSTYKQKERYLENLKKLESRSIIISDAADTSATIGPAAAWKQMREQIAESKDSTFGKVATGIKGSLAIATSAVGNFLNAFSVWGQVLAAAGIAYSIFDGYMSSGAKEAAAFADSTSQVNDAATTLNNTIAAIKAKNPSEIFSTESLIAQANAVANLNASLESTLKAFDRMLATRSGWESLKDFFADMVGSGSGDALANSIALSIVDTAKTLKGPELIAYKKEIEKVLGGPVDLKNLKSIKALYKDLDENVIRSFGDTIVSVNKNANKSFIDSTRSLQSFKDNISSLTKEVENYSNSLIPTDAFSKFSVGLMKLSQDVAGSFGTAESSLQSIRDLSENIKVLSLIDPEEAKRLALASDTITKLSTDLGTIQIGLDAAKSRKDSLNEELNSLKDSKLLSDLLRKSTINVDLKNEDVVIRALEDRLAALKNSATNITDKFKEIPNILAKASIDNLEKGLNSALAKASNEFSKGLSSIIGQAGGFTGILETKLNQEDIRLQKADIEAKYQNITATKLLTIAVQESNILARQDNIRKEINKTDQEIVYTRNPNEKEQEYLRNRNTLGTLSSAREAIQTPGGIKALSKDVASGAMGSMDTFRELGDIINQYYGKLQAEASLSFKDTLERIKKDIAKDITKPTADRKETLKNENDILDTQIASLNITKSTSDSYSKQLEDKLFALNAQKDFNNYISSWYDIVSNIAVQEKVILESKDAEVIATAKAAKQDLETKQSRLTNLYAENKLIKGNKKTIDDIVNKYKEENTLAKNKYDLYKLTSKNSEIDLNNAITMLDLQKEAGILTDKEYRDTKYSLDLTQALATAESNKAAVLESYREKLNDLASKEAQQRAEGITIENDIYGILTKTVNEKERILELQNQELIGADKLLKGTQERLNLSKQIAEQADWKKFKEGLADALASALEEGFKNGENFAESFAKFVQNSLDNLVVKPTIKAGSEAMLDMVGLGNGKGIENLTKQFDTLTNVFKTDFGKNIEDSLAGGVTKVRDVFGDNAANAFNGFKTDMLNVSNNFGSSVNEFFGGTKLFQKGANGAVQALGYLDAAGDILSGKRIGEGIGKGLGTYLGGGNPLITKIGGELGKWVDRIFGGGNYVKSVTSVWSNFDKEGKLTSSSRGYDYTPTQDAKTEQQLNLVNARYQNLAKVLGVATVKLGMGLSVNDSDGGKYAFRSIYGDSNKEYVTGEQTYTAEGVANATNRAILLAIKESKLPKALQGIFDGVDLNALDQAGLEAFMTKMVQFSGIAKDLGTIGIPVLNDLGYQSLETLGELSGGIDKFANSVSGYISNFYTEQENIDFARKNIADTLIAAGAISKSDELPKTREGFRTLVESFKDTTPEALRAVNALMQVQGAFANIVPVTEDLVKKLTDTELTMARLDQQVEILKLLGQEEAALALTRQRELDAMDERLRPMQKYLYALQDQKTAQDKIRSIYDKTTASVKNAASQIKSLDDAINAMKLGQNSPLTPLQKYGEAKAQVEALKQAIATNTGSDQASIDAKNDALNKLPGATNTFLESSRTLFASSEQYTKDFSEMLGVLSSNKLALESQKTLEQQTVDNLKSSNTFLSSIDLTLADLPAALSELAAATASIARTRAAAFDQNRALSISSYIKTLEWGNKSTEKQSAENVYSAAQRFGVTQAEIANAMNLPYQDVVEFFAAYGIPAFAKGGYASGLSLVGEQGPELVDFKSPGRVYSNTSSNDMFANANKELIAEVRSLRQEVSQLRQEQKEQTGHLIATNYDANNKVAVAVTESAESSTTNANWVQRSQAKIA